VDAGVDLAGLEDDAVSVSDDGRAVTIVLPAARLYDAELDLDRSYVFEREEGLLNRIGGIFSGSDEYEREAMLVAEGRLNEAARANGELAASAEENTAAMLRGLVRGLGFQRVDVRFE
jgi:hypothetical protein